MTSTAAPGHGAAPTDPDAERARHDRHAVPVAAGLWVLVLVALTYGVVQTLTKVVALFS